ncbi:hypothetical protein NA57DRAFT_73808 [Rhizodiscina lignyota]|uniref:Uncharacterized protein n=1 Tax=Rhizodiscina lignyota TaxID=1504668 RepID=A0A9P4M7N7_9PEZI|nr:hypothetical protein NA57DRAFT_73808 [Rhizodiscina lignyota]
MDDLIKLAKSIAATTVAGCIQTRKERRTLIQARITESTIAYPSLCETDSSSQNVLTKSALMTADSDSTTVGSKKVVMEDHSFLKLPGEIKNRIYHYVFCSKFVDVELHLSPFRPSRDGWGDWELEPLPGIVLANRQTYAEAFALAFKHVVFSINDEMLLDIVLARCRPNFRSQIRQLGMRFPMHCGPSFWCKFLPQCTGLETVFIELDFRAFDSRQLYRIPFDHIVNAISAVVKALFTLKKPQVFFRCCNDEWTGAVECEALRQNFYELVLDAVRKFAPDSEDLRSRVQSQFHLVTHFCWNRRLSVNDICPETCSLEKKST